MTGSWLDRLAAAYGLQRHYIDYHGQAVNAPDSAVEALLRALGVDPSGPEAENTLPGINGLAMRVPGDIACYLPDFLHDGRCWGVSCQLYALRSARNWGIGDFEDLARLAELLGPLGADFLGVNPLHDLFAADPGKRSPISPCHRRFLNPVYIAIDTLPGYSGVDPALLEKLRAGEMVDYPAVIAAKRGALRAIFEDSPEAPEMLAFRERHGEALEGHALFQALSLAMVEQGHGAGWHDWPAEYRDPASRAVAAFRAEQAREVDFQIWLQWIADRQLAEAASRAEAAGMRIGLYLDYAVGIAPDGSATWSDPTLTVVGAEIGSPPDMFNAHGQKWGLAPLSPAELARRDFVTLDRAYDAALHHAGALRIDHAMSLHRLFWVPIGRGAEDGVYALYPMEDMVRSLAEASQARKSIIIGEDLGIVPEGFRDLMSQANILGYRVFYFERDEQGFVPPGRYPRESLACIGSHDTATLAGWWKGCDIDRREALGSYDAAQADAAHEERDRHRLEA
ncbi:MAG: 4-alpha-glucanotransferase, partial [Alphaproteobacteria bacterium]|nr:4-alpha-glucanotransferase [Alphaproteobacteria bacterium]